MLGPGNEFVKEIEWLPFHMNYTFHWRKWAILILNMMIVMKAVKKGNMGPSGKTT